VHSTDIQPHFIPSKSKNWYAYGKVVDADACEDEGGAMQMTVQSSDVKLHVFECKTSREKSQVKHLVFDLSSKVSAQMLAYEVPEDAFDRRIGDVSHSV
jgi:hypothetical protein